MDITQYARWFRSSTPYIQAHRGRTFVVLLPGEALAAPNLVNIVHDIALTHVLGARVILVHGARPQLDAALQSESAAARRVTRAEDLPQLMQVHGELRARLEALFSTGLPNTPLHGSDIAVASGNLIVARPLGIVDGIDHQFTGQVRQVHHERVRALLDSGAIVLMSPFGYSPSGQLFNLPSDELAAATARAVAADKLIVLDETTRLPDAAGQLASLLSPADLEASIEANTQLGAGTRNRLIATASAVRSGVPRAHVVSHLVDGALLAELYTAGGHGTQISEQAQTPIRAARADDIAGIVELIRPLEEQGALVRRSRDRLEAELAHFIVAELDGIVIGCCALFPFEDSAELACVAVHSSFQKQHFNKQPVAEAQGDHGSIGQRLLAFAEQQARDAKLTALFVLTTQAQDWFTEQGFTPISPDQLPAPRQSLYNYQRNSAVMRKPLSPSKPA